MSCCFVFEKFQIKMINLYLLLNSCVVIIYVFFKFISGVKDMNSISVEASLGDLGLDSLMGVEIKQTLERDFDLVLSTTEIRQLTITNLKEMSNNEQQHESSPLPVTSYRYQLDKMMPDQPIICLQEKEDKILFLVHPLEGIFNIPY